MEENKMDLTVSVDLTLCCLCCRKFKRRKTTTGFDKFPINGQFWPFFVMRLEVLQKIYHYKGSSDGHICGECERQLRSLYKNKNISTGKQSATYSLYSPIPTLSEPLNEHQHSESLTTSTPPLSHSCYKTCKKNRATCCKLVNAVTNCKYYTAFRLLLSRGKAAQQAFNRVVKKRAEKEIICLKRDKLTEFPVVTGCRSVEFEEFPWTEVCDHVATKLPTLSAALNGSILSSSRSSRTQLTAVPRMGFVASVILYHHQPTTFKFAQAMIGLQMFRCGASNELFKYLNHLGICQSATITKCNVDHLAKECDVENTQGTNSIQHQVHDSYTNETPDDPDCEQVDETLTSDLTANAAVAHADMTESRGECDQVPYDRDAGIDTVNVATLDDTGNVLFGCNECGATFSDPDDLSNHAATAGCDRNDGTDSDDVTETKTPPYIVESESVSAASGASADFQMLKSPNSVNLCCPQCDAGFARKRDLDEHIRLMHAVFQCSICNEHFKTRRELKSHVSHHTDDGSLICVDCNKTFESSETLKEHEQGCMRSWHFGRSRRTPSKRLDCSRQLSHSHSIADAYHARCHSERTQPVTCGLCTQQFTLMYKLHMHTAREHIASPMCVICYRDLDTWHELKEHLLAHTGESNVLKGEKELVEDDSSAWQPLGVVSWSDDRLGAHDTRNEIIDMDHNYSFPASSENADVLKSRDQSSVDVLNSKVETTRAKRRRKFVR